MVFPQNKEPTGNRLFPIRCVNNTFHLKATSNAFYVCILLLRYLYKFSHVFTYLFIFAHVHACMYVCLHTKEFMWRPGNDSEESASFLHRVGSSVITQGLGLGIFTLRVIFLAPKNFFKNHVSLMNVKFSFERRVGRTEVENNQGSSEGSLM